MNRAAPCNRQSPLRPGRTTASTRMTHRPAACSHHGFTACQHARQLLNQRAVTPAGSGHRVESRCHLTLSTTMACRLRAAGVCDTAVFATTAPTPTDLAGQPAAMTRLPYREGIPVILEGKAVQYRLLTRVSRFIAKRT